MSDVFEKPVILFDGVCNLCSSSVQFVINNDRKAKFLMGSLQSKEGNELAKKFNVDAEELRTFILIENDKAYQKSTAALRVTKKLNGLWPLLYIFIIIPPFLRNAVYDFIASNRYKWFGKKETCWIPDPELRSRFIENF